MSTRQSSVPWGYKATVFIYVEGDVEKAMDASDLACAAAESFDTDFIGVSIDPVQERPKDQGGS